MKKKVFSVVVSFCVTIALVCSILPMSASAATTQQQAVDWCVQQAAKAKNERFAGYTGQWGAQCTNFVTAYMNYVTAGNPYGGKYGVTQYARNYHLIAQADPANWQVITNTPSFVPQPGDIFVAQYTSTGHVGVVVSSNVNTAVIVDQNSAGSDYGSPPKQYAINWGNPYYKTTYYLRYKHFSTGCSHAYSTASEWVHPHKVYKKCSKCGDWHYTGATSTANHCNGCQPSGLPKDFYAKIIHTTTKLAVTNDNSNVAIHKDTGAKNQWWHFQQNSQGHYKITSLFDNRCLDVANYGDADQTNLQVSVNSNNDAQKWNIFDYKSSVGLKSVALRANCTTRLMDVSGNHIDGANIQTFTENGATSQSFTITPVMQNPFTTPTTPSTTPTPQPTTPSTTYKITLNANSGSVNASSLTTNTSGKLSSLPTPTRSGYTFDGWYTSSNGGTRVSTSTTFSSNSAIYAHWTKNATTNNNSGNNSDNDTPNYEPNTPTTPTVPTTLDLQWSCL